jgi:hypothetical protein
MANFTVFKLKIVYTGLLITLLPLIFRNLNKLGNIVNKSVLNSRAPMGFTIVWIFCDMNYIGILRNDMFLTGWGEGGHTR